MKQRRGVVGPTAATGSFRKLLLDRCASWHQVLRRRAGRNIGQNVGPLANARSPDKLVAEAVAVPIGLIRYGGDDCGYIGFEEGLCEMKEVMKQRSLRFRPAGFDSAQHKIKR